MVSKSVHDSTKPRKKDREREREKKSHIPDNENGAKWLLLDLAIQKGHGERDSRGFLILSPRVKVLQDIEDVILHETSFGLKDFESRLVQVMIASLDKFLLMIIDAVGFTLDISLRH